MRSLVVGLMPCLLMAQASALSFDDILSRARGLPGQYRAEALLAGRQRTLAGGAGFLREPPTLGFAAGPRTHPSAPGATDRSVELDLPLFLSPGVRKGLEAALGQADPLVKGAARIEARFQVRQAYLDAWLAERLLRLREADSATVLAWREAAQARLDAGVDPAFQLSLVDGEALRAQAGLEEARQRHWQAWARLRGLADLPSEPSPLEDPGDLPALDEEKLRAGFERGALCLVLRARLDLDRASFRHQEALSASRWSLKGSWGQEGEERIAKVGLAYRFPLPGERGALRRETQAEILAAEREMEAAMLELEGRFQGALARLQTARHLASFQPFELALKAVGLRLREGRERPSEALPIRRQLLEAQVAAYGRLHAAHLLAAELQTLTAEVIP